MTKIGKIIYYLFYAVIFLIAVGVIFPLLPIPGNYQLLTVLSGSMEPKIKTGSVVAVKPADDYKIGDIINFGKNEKLKTATTHRIHDIRIEKGNPVYITKGDANNAPDTKEVSPEEINGKVILSVPFAGYAVNAAQKPLGFMIIIVIPAVIIIGDEIKKIGKEIKGMREKKKEKKENGEKEERRSESEGKQK